MAEDMAQPPVLVCPTLPVNNLRCIRMAAISNDLFDLIHSMSAPEKAYFKRYGYKNGARRQAYLDLFDAVEKQESFNEAALRKKFAPPKGFKSLSSAKNHLYHQVLHSLMEYNADKSGEDQVIQLMQEVWFLKNRGLEDQCAKRLKVAWKTIAEQDQQAFSPALFPAEFALIPYAEQGFIDRFTALEREKHTLALLQNQNEYSHLYARMTQMVSTWGVIVRDPRHIEAVESVLAHPLLQEESLALSFQAKYMLHSVNKILNQVICRYDTALEHARKAVLLHERFPELLSRHHRSYLMSLFNLLNDLVGGGKFEEFEMWKDRIHSVVSALPDSGFKIESEANLTCRIVYKEILFRNYQAAFHEVGPLIKGLDRFAFQPHLSIQHRYLIACAAFYTGRLEEAHSWIAGLLADEHLEHYRDFFSFALILNLIIHLELGHREHLAYARERVYRMFSKRDMLFEVERIFLAFLRRYERIPEDPSVLRKAFEELRDQLLPLQGDAYERNAFDYFDFLVWLDARIQHKTMLEAAEEWRGKFALRPA